MGVGLGATGGGSPGVPVNPDSPPQGAVNPAVAAISSASERRVAGFGTGATGWEAVPFASGAGHERAVRASMGDMHPV